MPLDTLKELYVDELKDAYSAEKQIVKALPGLIEKASMPELRRAFEEHLDVTRQHVKRLETIFKDMAVTRRAKLCKGMQGLLKEGKELMQKEAEPAVMDAGLIGAAQRVEHYEMAAYGTLRSFAQALGYASAADLLQQTLNEEAEADRKLSSLAERCINPEATAGEQPEEFMSTELEMIETHSPY